MPLVLYSWHQCWPALATRMLPLLFAILLLVLHLEPTGTSSSSTQVQPRAVLLIVTACLHHQKRTAQRKTWLREPDLMQHSDLPIIYKYVVGKQDCGRDISAERVCRDQGCIVFGLRDRGMGGYGGKKICVSKMGLSFLALYSKFHLSPGENFSVLSGWVGGWVCQITPSPPPPTAMGRAGGRGKGTIVGTAGGRGQ